MQNQLCFFEKADMELIELTNEYFNDFLKMAQEFDAESDNRYSKHVKDKISFEQYIEYLGKFKNIETVPDGFVQSYTFFAVDEKKLIGAIRYRPKINDGLLLEGGHIGYDVRPTFRNLGYASAMLKIIIEKIKPTHEGKILITCDSNNLVSEKVILKNHGILENETISQRTGKKIKRFWIELSN
jgi:predicted acetyltransferase